MHLIPLRGVGVLVMGAALVALSGCAVPKYKLQVVNAGDYPLTSVRLIPYLEDAEEQQEAFENAANLLPTDDNNATIALGSGETVTVPGIILSGEYYLQLNFFVHGEYESYQHPNTVELTEIPDGALVIMTAKRERADTKNEPKIDVQFSYTLE